MNREILFRGFREDPTGDKVIFVDGKAVRGYWLYGGIREMMDGNTEFYHIQKRETDMGFNCIPSTVGQYTGLKDKNGKKIFEGDIVKTENPKPFKPYIRPVVYATTSFIWGDYVLGEFEHPEKLEVIGNIFDNPELLEATP